ncbi:MAG TPA: aldehyde reductase [Solirubrobacteraceae bacterium]|nr:aldehyde reductase [Solirubrobacteraceae bacterium]
MGDELVLVTGGSGFIGAHCVARLLGDGYRVRTTVRSLGREAGVREMLRAAGAGADAGDRLSFTAADLTADAGWDQAAADVDYVLHVASPFPIGVPKHEDELIVPARDGALRVLHAARRANVKRVVLTSSFAAIGYGPAPAGKVFTEADWTDPNAPGISAYVKSKTVAELAAWDFIQAHGDGMEMAVVNPVGVLGPVLGPDYSTSIQLVSRLLDGSVPGLPRLSFNIVDVRDVADLHVRAMLAPQAAGERFLAVTGEPVTMAEISGLLRAKLGDRARKAPSRVLPNWVVKLVSNFDRSLKQIVPELDEVRPASNQKAREVLGWEPRSRDEAILATAQSLISLGQAS